MTAKTSEKFSARLAASGIAAGAIASRFVAQLSGFENSIGFDMGGTSTDVCLCDSGVLPVTKDWHVEYGYPICFPSIEVLTIGAGGGSLAWIDKGGSLRNGPQSAGSRPGPACYNQGGTEPTNSDANVMLGRLGTSLAGGAIQLHRDLGRESRRRTDRQASWSHSRGGRAFDPQGCQRQHGRCGAPGFDPQGLRSARFRACRIRRGRRAAWRGAGQGSGDPDRAGAAQSGRHFGARAVSLWTSRTTFRACISTTSPTSRSTISTTRSANSRSEGRDRLLHEGVPDDRMVFQRFIDMRYLGQWRSMSIAVPSPLTLARCRGREIP